MVLITGAPVSGPTRGIGQKFCYLLFKQEAAAPPVNSTFYSLSYSSTRTFFSNIFVVLRIDYKIIICINDNNSVINNNLGRLHVILLFKIPMGT